MVATVFDTLKFARTLRDKAKFSPEQAEGVADAMAEALQGDFVTKGDLQSVRSDLRAELREVELRLETKIEATKNDLLKWFVGIAFAQSALTVTLLKLFPARLPHVAPPEPGDGTATDGVARRCPS